MTTSWGMVALVGLCLAACGKDTGKAEDKQAPGKPAVAAPGKPAVTDAGATCAAACERRKACSVPGGDDVARCTSDCEGLAELYPPDQLARYVAAPCAEVAQAETAFRAAASCKQACAHRAGCIAEASDQKACLGDCTALAMLTGVDGIAQIDTYAAASCDVARQQEPGFVQAGTCVRGCAHVLQCGVAGTFPSCMGECADNLASKAITLEQIDGIIKADCATVKSSVQLRQPAVASAPAGGGGATCDDACRNYDRCKVQPFDACMKDCAAVPAERLPRYAYASCEQLRSGDFGDMGYGCMREGKHDCSPGMMCCHQRRASQPGEQGMCLYAALCYGAFR